MTVPIPPPNTMRPPPPPDPRSSSTLSLSLCPCHSIYLVSSHAIHSRLQVCGKLPLPLPLLLLSQSSLARCDWRQRSTSTKRIDDSGHANALGTTRSTFPKPS